MKIRKETNNRGLTIPTNNEDSDGGTYADAVKKTTEKGLLASWFGYK